MNSCALRIERTLREEISSLRLNLTRLLLVTLVLALGASFAVANTIPQINNPLVPAAKAPGGAAFTLTVNGTGFVSGAVVNWNGNARTTTFVSSTKVTASITAADVAVAGTATVTVSNPAPGGGASNAAFFEIVKAGFTVAYGKLDYATASSPQDVVSGDFNKDGKVDLAVASSANSVSVLLGAGNGTFPTHVEYGVPGHPISIITGDFNNDGKLDLVTVDLFLREVSILLGNGDGTFQTHQDFAVGTNPAFVVAADLNGDGKLDLAVTDTNDNKVAILLGNGDGTFAAHVDYPTGNGPVGLAVGDFNADGKLDLVVANNTDSTVAILLGNGDGTFQGPIPFQTATFPNSVVVGDFNNDGILDLALGTSNKSLSVLLGVGDGTFQNHRDFGIGATEIVTVAGDLNSDGKIDLVTVNSTDNTISTLVGNGDGTFKGQSIFTTSAAPTGVALGDFNNNGKLDIAVASATANAVSVFTDSFISLAPNVIGFGKQTSGFASPAKVVTLKNGGTTPYTVGAFSFVGASAPDFTQTNNCGTTVAPLGTCTINIVFTPQASELANVQMLITASNGSVMGVEMTGNGNIPITLNPRNMTFATQLIGTTSPGKVATFTNSSGVPITFTNIDLEGTNQDEFGLSTTCPVNTGSLAPGASCTSTITFTPNQSGGATTSQIFYGSFTLAKQGLLASAQGTAVKVTPPSLSFPPTTVGSTSAPMTVTFQNAGSTAMTISSTNFIGNGRAWGIANTSTCGTSVPANSSCKWDITFTPPSVGTFTGTFSIGDPDPTGPQKVTLTGTGQ